jgi:hypothetical protein
MPFPRRFQIGDYTAKYYAIRARLEQDVRFGHRQPFDTQIVRKGR